MGGTNPQAKILECFQILQTELPNSLQQVMGTKSNKTYTNVIPVLHVTCADLKQLRSQS